LEVAVSIARGSLLNLAGHVAPLAAAVVAVPLLIERLSPEKFGFLSLAWVIVGYFSLFDLGLGRTLTRLIAEHTGTSREKDLPGLVRTALIVLACVGCAASLALFFLAPWLCASVLKLPLALQAQASSALQVLAWCLPFVTLTSAMRGMLEAGQKFGWVNGLRIPMGVLLFLLPVWISQYSTNLVDLCKGIAFLRIAATLAHGYLCMKLFPQFMLAARTGYQHIRQLLADGSWLTLSNVIGPMMVYLDRFIIASMVSVVAVAYYTAPFEVVTRLWLLPAALTGALFPVFAAQHQTRPAEVRRLYRKAFRWLFATMSVLAAAVGMGAPYWLGAWLGSAYAQEGLLAAQILTLGVFVNSLGYLPLCLLQASGHADASAKLHLAEIPLYVIALILLVSQYGIEGAAAAWAGRCLLDTVCLMILVRRRHQMTKWLI